MNKENHKKKVLIVAPFWKKSGHVGNYRVELFIRWLISANHSIYVLNAGKRNSIRKTEWGIVITKKDYIFIITESLRNLSSKPILKLVWYAWLSIILLFSPIDELFLWASRILSDIGTEKYFKDADLIISTSPPNSSHIAAYKISKKFSIPFMTDFRDGWLDEPFEQKINKSFLLRNKEKIWEKSVLVHSSKIMITSKIWKKMLEKRFPEMLHKMTVITNAYPKFDFTKKLINPKINYQLKTKLLYAGRFASSRKSQNPEILLGPIYNAIKNNFNNIEIIFLSELRREEITLFNKWRDIFSIINISLNLESYVPRIQVFETINLMDGLLLLSNVMGSLPSKIFEYIKSGKPILAVTLKGSAVWQLSEKLPQLFLYDINNNIEDYTSIERFLIACKIKDYKFAVPDEFTEDFLSKIFLNEVNNILS